MSLNNESLAVRFFGRLYLFFIDFPMGFKNGEFYGV